MNKQIVALKMSVKDGYTPKKGVDYFDGKDGEPGKVPTNEQLVKLIKPLIPKPIKGDPGKDSYVPGPKGDSIKGDPGKDGSPDTPSEIVNKINTLTNVIEIKTIKGLFDTIKALQLSIRDRKGGSGKSGGGMGNIQHEEYATSSATTSISTSYKIAGMGNALWVSYNGQDLSKGTHFTVGSDQKAINLLITLQDSTHVKVTYIRT